VAEALRRGDEVFEPDPAVLRGASVLHWDGVELVLRVGDRIVAGAIERRGGRLRVHFEGCVWEFDVSAAPRAGVRDPSAPSELYAPMTGTVVQVFAREGEDVAAGAALLVVEAMKMEHRIVAPAAARILRLHVKAGDRVDVGADLVSLKLEGPK
jgi:acetyl/propionyl-CoA carboxylase alpha subunit